MEQITLKKNDELEVEIIRLGAGGEGVAVHNGIVIFVPQAMVGERVLVHIINDKHSFLVAKIIKHITLSKDRVVPPCPYYTKCGGCDLQHMNYKTQLELKREIVKNSLEKYAKISVPINEVIASDEVFGYRNKFAFPVSEVAGEIKIGMFKKNTHDVIDISSCMLQSNKAQDILKLFKEYMLENKISAYNEAKKSGTVKHIVMREHGDAFILTVVVTDKKFNNFDPLIKKLQSKFDKFGIVKNVNNLHNNVIFGNFDEKIYGLGELEISEFGIDYTVNNRSFMQINDNVKTKIYQKIIDCMAGEKNIIDAYSGAGLLSSVLAKNCAAVWGVEIIKEATENANNLKNKNKLYNLTNKNGDCAKLIPELAKGLNGDFAVVVDPPRKGLDKLVVEAFLKSEPNKIVYLSCNPATLARDLAMLVEKYNIEFVQPYDMFPQTANVETLVCLTNKKGAKIIKKPRKKVQKLSERSRYFDFYDDVKAGCHKVIDW